MTKELRASLFALIVGLVIIVKCIMLFAEGKDISKVTLTGELSPWVEHEEEDSATLQPLQPAPSTSELNEVTIVTPDNFEKLGDAVPDDSGDSTNIEQETP